MKSLKASVLTAGILVSSWSGVALAAGFEPGGLILKRPSVNHPVPENNQPCVCELVKGQWVCIPKGCMGSFNKSSSSGHRQLRPEEFNDNVQPAPYQRQVLPQRDPVRHRLPAVQ